MPSQGPLSSLDGGTNDASVGTIAWTNPGNSISSDNADATASLNTGDVTNYLKSLNHGFSIPTGATIDGIVVEFERAVSSPNRATDSAIRIVKGGVIGSTNRSAGAGWPGSDTYASFGGASDLWGETWTPADINASDFGVVLSATCPGDGGGTPVAQVDHIRITVYYSEPQTISVTGIPSAEAFGTPNIDQGVKLQPGGIASAEAFGTPMLSPGPIGISPGGIASAEAFGTPMLSKTIEPVGIASEEAFGTPGLVFYVATGFRISPPLDLSALEVLDAAVIEWAADLPDTTTVKIETSRDGVTWTEVTASGAEARSYSRGENVEGEALYVKATLTTNRSGLTPTLESLSVRAKSLSRFTGEARFPQGVFLLSSPRRSSGDSGGITIEVEAYDQLVVLRDDKVTARYTVTAGTEVVGKVEALLEGAGISSHNIEPSALELPADRDWDPGTSKLTIINDLLGEVAYDTLTFDESGVAVSQPYLSPELRPASYTYEDDDSSVTFEAATESLDLFDVPNRWVLIVSEPDRAAMSAEYVNDNPDSPTSTAARGRTIVKVVTGVQAVDQASLAALAERMAFEDSQIYQEAELRTALMPHHSHEDVLTIVLAALGLSDTYLEAEWEMPLVAGGEMVHRLRKVSSI